MSIPPRVLYFFSYDHLKNPWVGGGGSVRDHEILSRFPKSYKIKLITGHYPKAQSASAHGYEHCAIGIPWAGEWISRASYWFLAWMWMLLLPKSVLLGITSSPYAPFFWLYPIKPRSFVVIHHRVGDEWRQKMPKLWFFFDWLEQIQLKASRNAIVINSELQTWLETHGNSRNILQNGNAFDDDLLNIQRQPQKTFLFFGRWDIKMKGLDLLLEAWARVTEQYPDYQLVIAGRERKEDGLFLRQKIAELNLHTVQLIPNPSDFQKKTLLAQAMCYVSPSRYEGWGIAALEAAAAACPVIVSRATGFVESLGDCTWAQFVDLQTQGSLESEMIKMIRLEEHQRTQLGQGLRQYASHYTWDALALKESQWLDSLEAKGVFGR